MLAALTGEWQTPGEIADRCGWPVTGQTCETVEARLAYVPLGSYECDRSIYPWRYRRGKDYPDGTSGAADGPSRW